MEFEGLKHRRESWLSTTCGKRSDGKIRAAARLRRLPSMTVVDLVGAQ